MRKIKKVPQRKCLGCQSIRPKKDLLRIVRTPQGEVIVDPTGKKAGRGAYVCINTDCFASLQKNKQLQRMLEIELTQDFWKELDRFIIGK